jgi:hypothetical protein
MRVKEILTEYRFDLVINPLRDKLITQMKRSWVNVRFDPSDEMIEYAFKSLFGILEDIDPTPNNKYVPWLAREFALGNIRLIEDLSEFTPLLQAYHRGKSRLDPTEKDILRLDANQLHYVANKLIDTEPLVKKGSSGKFFSNSDLTIVVPYDKDAACYYGQGTRWCTASTRSENYFDHYNESGPLYILLPKNPQYSGEKYQLHFEENQFMNERDQPVLLFEIDKRFNGIISEKFKSKYPDAFAGLEWEDLDTIRYLIDKIILFLEKKLGPRGGFQPTIEGWEAYLHDFVYEWRNESLSASPTLQDLPYFVLYIAEFFNDDTESLNWERNALKEIQLYQKSDGTWDIK